MTLFSSLLSIHIVGGFTSLLLGSYILSTKKGDKRHKIIGKIYFYAMLASALVSLPMAYLHSDQFLFIVGVFTSYMLLSGIVYLGKKQSETVTKIDWSLMGIMLIFAIIFLVFGGISLFKGNTMGIVLLVFGVVSLFFVRQDYQNFRGLSSIKNYWLIMHINRMVGSYIASVTAFLVVNQPPIPAVITWLAPTLVLTPLIIKWSRKYTILKKNKIER